MPEVSPTARPTCPVLEPPEKGTHPLPRPSPAWREEKALRERGQPGPSPETAESLCPAERLAMGLSPEQGPGHSRPERSWPGPSVPSPGFPSAWGAAWLQRPWLCSVDLAEARVAAASGGHWGSHWVRSFVQVKWDLRTSGLVQASAGTASGALPSGAPVEAPPTACSHTTWGDCKRREPEARGHPLPGLRPGVKGSWGQWPKPQRRNLRASRSLLWLPLQARVCVCARARARTRVS